MSAYESAVDRIAIYVPTPLTGTVLATGAFDDAIWAERQIQLLEASGDPRPHTEIHKLASYRDAMLVIVGRATRMPSHRWLDDVRQIASEQVSA